MSKLIAIRLDETLLAGVDAERRRARVTRAAAVKQALVLWLERRRYQDAVCRDQAGYERHPVSDDEFGPVLGAQAWPK
jgi:Arc/MetJ-type ribon-helix-helix transcriptional regulator